MWIRASKNSLEKPLGLEWCAGVKTLGIHFSYDQGQIMKQNFHERLSDIQKTINLWSLRGLSLFGKVTVGKSFLIPKLLYVSTIYWKLRKKLLNRWRGCYINLCGKVQIK